MTVSSSLGTHLVVGRLQLVIHQLLSFTISLSSNVVRGRRNTGKPCSELKVTSSSSSKKSEKKGYFSTFKRGVLSVTDPNEKFSSLASYVTDFENKIFLQKAFYPFDADPHQRRRLLTPLTKRTST